MEDTQKQVNADADINQNFSPVNTASNQRGNLLPIIGIVLLVLVVGAGGYFLYQKRVIKQSSTTTASPKPSIEIIKSGLFYLNPGRGAVKVNQEPPGLYSLNFKQNEPEIKQLLPIVVDTNYLTDFEFSPNGQYLAWKNDTSRVTYLKIENGTVGLKNIHTDVGTAIISLAFSPDSKYIALLESTQVDAEHGINSPKIKIFSLDENKFINEFSILKPANGGSDYFTWSKSNKLRIIFYQETDPNDNQVQKKANFIAASYTPEGIKEFEHIFYKGMLSFRPGFDISKDGESFAFSTLDSELIYGNFIDQNVKKLIDLPMDVCSGAHSIFISPNKKNILIGGCGVEGKGALFNMDNSTLLTVDIPISTAIWSDDSNLIWAGYYTRTVGKNGATNYVYILNSSGKIIRKMDSFNPNIYVSWIP